MRTVPDTIRNEILNKIYELADQEGYLTNNRVDNAAFMGRLLSNPDIGGTLDAFMPKEKVRVYIKDSMLNRYAKDRRSVTLEKLLCVLAEVFQQPVSLVDTNNDVSLCNTESGFYIVVTIGSYTKWETALKKILLYIGKTSLINQDREFKKIIVISTGGVPMPTGEEEVLKRALSEVGVGVLVL
ncbi:hypothetical protein GPJ61_24585 [Brevibacillus formosus]|uniref:hypothetical protein n=1 Tax=Brevibacillus formosus TaxID=54913 RepID=UPI001CA4A4F2|nr:hypothetical protein [Brevibacillus formosus]MBW5470993.1 hypothetical protein [Brevibacillus formosus]